MRFLTPKGRWGVFGRALGAAFIVIICAGAATAVAGLLQVKTIAVAIGKTPALKKTGVTVPPPGAPQTLLLIGADRRIGESTSTVGNTDTMLLVRINDQSQTINVLSIPRDLMINTADGGIEKLNSAYAAGGPQGLRDVIRQQVFPGFQYSHVVVVSFLGFAHLINDVGCVYAPVDQRYYNHNDVVDDTAIPGYVDDFSDIDLHPGYQKLCGQSGGAKSALAFVRFRHTDSDLVRNARQQDFLRWAKGQFGSSYLENNYDKLAGEFGKNSQSDPGLHSVSGLLNLFGVLIHADGHQVKSIQFPEATTTVDGGDYVIPTSTAAEHRAYREFMTPTKEAPVVKKKKKKHHHKHHKHAFKVAAGMAADPTDGQTQANQLGDPGIPIYYPQYIPEAYGYCFTSTENCDETALEPATAYNNSYPRRYKVTANHRKYAAWVMTLLYDAQNGDGLATGLYFNVQGLAWKNPPLLKPKHQTKMVNGKKLLIYSQGGVVSTVAWRTSHAVYWIQNTLVNAHGAPDASAIPNKQMIDMAATLTAYPSSLKYGQKTSGGHHHQKR